ncbi:AI-2E family transporter YdiK [Bdellovibrio sp. GT3]|uniref:AI-2E family transporter YdiK n=1 Tax=Bdellovibrio sp. GT3 TaxID=3136282 RepID=UPI0030F16F73
MSTEWGLARSLFASIFILLLIAGCFWIMTPFLPSLIWATMIVVATWPLLVKAERKFGSRKLAVVAMMLVMSVIVILPLMVTGYVLLTHIDEAYNWLKGVKDYTLPMAPAGLAQLPFGDRIASDWNAIAEKGPGALAELLRPHLRRIFGLITAAAQSTGLLFVHLILTTILSGILYAKGEFAAKGVIMFFRRIDGDRGESAVVLAGQSVKSVAMGIVVTALLQTTLGTLGVWIAGVPYVGILGATMLVLCIAQIGPILPMLGAVVWLFQNNQSLAGSILLAWTFVVGLMDNVIRPLLIKRGADLPLLLIFAGVIGGLLAFGVVGLFIGPMTLAVAYRLVEAWTKENPKAKLTTSFQAAPNHHRGIYKDPPRL